MVDYGKPEYVKVGGMLTPDEREALSRSQSNTRREVGEVGTEKLRSCMIKEAIVLIHTFSPPPFPPSPSFSWRPPLHKHTLH